MAAELDGASPTGAHGLVERVGTSHDVPWPSQRSATYRQGEDTIIDSSDATAMSPVITAINKVVALAVMG